MSTSDSSAPSWKPLDPGSAVYFGVLIEKAKTTPAGYPMSVNAIVAGCNQKNNRDPVTSYDDFGVEKALDELRTFGAVSEIDWLGRVSKWKHQAEWLAVDKAELAVMAELMLRGAQTLGELRARAARMEPIADLAALKPIVDGLIQRGLMLELSRAGPGPGRDPQPLSRRRAGRAQGRALRQVVGAPDGRARGTASTACTRCSTAARPRRCARSSATCSVAFRGRGSGLADLRPAARRAGRAPSEDDTHCELYLMCEDVEATLASLRERGVEATEPIADRGFGLMTAIRLPDGSSMGPTSRSTRWRSRPDGRKAT